VHSAPRFEPRCGARRSPLLPRPFIDRASSTRIATTFPGLERLLDTYSLGMPPRLRVRSIALIAFAAACAGFAVSVGKALEAEDPSPAMPLPTIQAVPGLMAAPATVHTACANIARKSHRQHSRWRVVCPPRIPDSANTAVSYAGGVLSTRNLRPGYLIDGRSPTPANSSSYDGHWTFAAGDPQAVHAWITVNHQRFTKQAAQLDRLPVSIYRLAPGSSELSSHLAIEWQWRGEAYQVSVHRWRSDRQGYVQAREMARATIRFLRRR
jgi:hypothetical protein